MFNWLINRAKRTPYFHLDGYMNRWWLVPYNVVIKRRLAPRKGDYAYGLKPDDVEPWMIFESTDGTGPVTWRRPLAKVIQKLGFAIRVHEILRSDLGRDPHDHPWSYVTIILKGGYYEQLFNDAGKLVTTSWHGPGSVLFRRAGTWHKLILMGGEPTTTLFITGQKKSTWGFNVKGEKVPYYQYEGADE